MNKDNSTFHTYSFEKLEVWQLGRQLKKELYILTSNFPKDERFGYISQMRRAASSITVNLAEGSGRASNMDKAHFTNISYSSALELVDHLIGVYDLNYITNDQYVQIRISLDHIINKLNALYKYQLNLETSLKNKLKT